MPYVLVILMTGVFSTVTAQPLDSLLVAADSANLELKALYYDYQAALEKGGQVRQLPDPEVGLGLFVLPVETRLGPQWVRVSATQMFPWFGTLDAREDLVVAMARADYERIEASRLNIHYKIRQAYYQLYEIGKQQEIQEQRIVIYKHLESLATQRVETARGSLADVLRIQVRRRDLEEQVAILENRKALPRAVINQLLNRNDTAMVTPVSALPEVIPVLDRASLLDEIREQHPALRMMALQQDAATSAIRLNHLEGQPSFALGLDYIAVGQRTDADPAGNGRDILSPSVRVRIPLYRNKYAAKDQEERLKIEALKMRSEDQYLQFRGALDAAIATMENKQIQYDLYNELRATTASALDLLTSAYSTEAKGLTDLLAVEDELMRYDLLALEAFVGMHEARAEIEKYLPLPVLKSIQ